MKRKAFLLLWIGIFLGACSPANATMVQTSSPTATPVVETAIPAATDTATLPPAEPTQTMAAAETAVPVESPLGMIVFYSDRDGNPEIYAMHTDGSGLVRLTDDPAYDDSPAISPDGTQVLFLTARHDPNPHFPDLKYEIYVVGIDGSNLRRLTETEAAEDHPSWSPDGSQILFDADYDGDGFYEIYRMDADGSELTRLTSNSANDQFADWSPDGRYIAFSSDRNGNWDIFVMNADGSSQQALTDSPDWELFPAWSPDGSQISFNKLSPGSRNTDVCVMGASGDSVRQLTDAPRFDENPVWSTDGSRIAFQTNRDGNFEIYVMNADGSDQHPLAAQAGDDLWPSWGISATPEETPAESAPPLAFSLEKSPQEFTSRETFQVGLGDLDGDGDLDGVFANPRTNAAEVWFNDGSGTFANSGQALTTYGHGVGVADFDGDGDLDVFITCHNSVKPSSIYLNDGSGFFQATGQDLGDKSFSGTEVNLLDINGDGFVDVHVQYYDPSGLPDKVYLNDGKANFSDSGLALDEETIAWGDLDGDGDMDYFGKRWGVRYVIWLNDGSGQFSTGWEMEDANTTVGGIVLGDFDGDGDLDALVANGNRNTGSYPTRLFLNDGTGQFSDSGQRLNETIGAELTAVDLDGDGDLDVFAANMDWPDEVWLNDGGVLSDSGLRLGTDADMSGKASFGDLDGDGDLDVVVGRFNGGAEIWFNLEN